MRNSLRTSVAATALLGRFRWAWIDHQHNTIPDLPDALSQEKYPIVRWYPRRRAAAQRTRAGDVRDLLGAKGLGDGGEIAAYAKEQLDADDAKQRRDREHAERVEAKRKECEARTAKNAAKRRKKKEAKLKRDAIAKGTGGTHSFEDDGSFLAKAKALVKEKE